MVVGPASPLLSLERDASAMVTPVVLRMVHGPPRLSSLALVQCFGNAFRARLQFLWFVL